MSYQPGFLMSFRERWLDDVEPRWGYAQTAAELIPNLRYLTGRLIDPANPGLPTVPGVSTWPAMSLLCGGGRNTGRSDRAQRYVRVVSLHIWCDYDQLEEHGETAAELARQIYASQAWSFWTAGIQGEIVDVIDGGPPIPHQPNLPAYREWEIVKLFNVHYELPRMDDTCCVIEEESPY